MKRAALLLCAILIGFVATAEAAPQERWFHVLVEDGDDAAETVRINLPLGAIEQMLPSVQSERIRHGKIRVGDDTHLEGIDLRAVWNAVRNADDGEFVTVEARDGKVRVAKSGGLVLLRVSDEGKGDDRVEVRVPIAVVDALLSGDSDEMDLQAALRALRETADGDLVTVTDGSSRVRIWIDASQSGR